MKATFNLKAIVKIAALASASVALSGCVYDLGLGYASDGYYDDEYGCDPYSDYDRYYDCDLGYGFNNIGYGGGWYDNYYYPGYGFFLFDNIGRRYPMRDQHRRYWGEKRHNWYRENRGRNGDSGRYQRRSRGYTEGAGSGAASWPERHSGRARGAEEIQHPHDGRRDERRGKNDHWRGRESRGAGAVPVPYTDIREGRGGSYGQPSRRPRAPDANAPPRQRDNFDQRQTPLIDSGQDGAATGRPVPEVRQERLRQQPVRQRVRHGGEDQPQ
ncbi:MAG: hypothetical protein HEQ34_02325 [Sphingorhabdus sp.]|uniref:hypothetical protein n=1 Tax=Sphingorhabdus sp. TaxID=1902408 RepID=UPI0025ECFFBE|nr:hypothetical protein [Sphingorhabdus sp.]MCO4090774.1 hypothetical protein [Sphingorhabdus sp.]